MTEVEDRWWDDLVAAALVGTARRAAPALTDWPVRERVGGSAEVALLDATAIGAALRRAGAAASRVDPGTGRPSGAAPDLLPLAPARARQLLDLLLTQSPVGPRLAIQAIGVWLDQAARAGVRVHHTTLVRLLDTATTAAALQSAVLPVLDNRGRWLVTTNPAWRWAVDAGADESAELEPAAWAQRPTAERVGLLAALRAVDRSAGLRLIESTWSSDSAPARAALLEALGAGLSSADEAHLERALDDRAAAVRDVARRLLDGLPGSARAERCGALLAPLVSSSGMLRKKVAVELPSAPDAAAVRDGLGKAPPGRSERGLWLERLAAGAPFEVWGEATGLDPAGVVAALTDADALAGLRTAAITRRDPIWSRALLDRVWDVRLAAALDADELTERMAGRLGQVTNLLELTAVLRIAPGPWSASVSDKVVARLSRLERPPQALPELVAVLGAALHVGSAAGLQRLVPADARPSDPLHQLAQYLTLVPTITESFR